MKGPKGKEIIILIEYCENIPHAVRTTEGVYYFELHARMQFIL